jgi:hypothetical protein
MVADGGDKDDADDNCCAAGRRGDFVAPKSFAFAKGTALLLTVVMLGTNARALMPLH